MCLKKERSRLCIHVFSPHTPDCNFLGPAGLPGFFHRNVTHSRFPPQLIGLFIKCLPFFSGSGKVERARRLRYIRSCPPLLPHQTNPACLIRSFSKPPHVAFSVPHFLFKYLTLPPPVDDRRGHRVH